MRTFALQKYEISAARSTPTTLKLLSLLQNPVGFAQALAVFRPTGCKTAVFKRLLLQN
jgi:hypothetical protein